MPNNKIVHVHILMNTGRLIKDFPNPSTDNFSPTGISSCDYLYITVTDDAGTRAQNANDLHLAASRSDEVRFYAVSESRNSLNPVILYRLSTSHGDSVFTNPHFSMEVSEHETAAPVRARLADAQSPNYKAHFWFAQNPVSRPGTEEYLLAFVLYRSNLSLYGYFQSSITFVVD